MDMDASRVFFLAWKIGGEAFRSWQRAVGGVFRGQESLPKRESIILCYSYLLC